MRRMQTLVAVKVIFALGLAAVAGAISGCQGAPELADADGLAPAVEPAPEPVDPPVGPSARAPETADESRGHIEPADAPGVIAPVAAASQGRSQQRTPPRGWRRDGRPVWWLDEPRRDDTRLAICAEALGADVLTARRNAVAAARATLASKLGVTVVNAQILAAVVRPIGAAEASPSAAKYVGYALASAPLSDDADPPR